MKNLIRKILKEDFHSEDENLVGNKLEVCSKNPITGYYRDGYCRTDENDEGSHTVCAKVTEEFLDFTNSRGNNLNILEPGDKWCLCAKRWKEANDVGLAPPIDENATNIKTLNIIGDEILTRKKLNESDPKFGTGKKPKGSSRRLYTDENPNDTVSVKFRTKEDIIDTLNKESFKSKPHKRQSQIINLIHQRVRAAYQNAKDSETKKRLKRAYDYIETQKEKSKQKTIRLQKENVDEKIICQCGHSLQLSDGGNDPYICHKCGNDNSKKELTERCWKGYTQKGMKTMFGKKYPNCVKINK